MNSVDEMTAGFAAKGLRSVENAPFGALTTYGVGGTCAVMVEVTSAKDAENAAEVISTVPGARVFVLGNGSNTLVADGGFDGVVVRVVASRNPDDFAVTVVQGTVSADGWMPLPVLARRSVAAGACGLEWAVGVPGTVGGAVRMNAGGHGSDVADSLVSARIVSMSTGRTAVLPADALGLHFRGSALGDTHLVTSAVFAVREPRGHDCAAELASIVSWRRENQPGGRNAGSVFVNPAPGEGSSGSLIDSAGLRGLSNGGATVSDKHANFIQAAPGSTAEDIVGLMVMVQDRVRQETGHVLRSEVRMVGFEDAVASRFADSAHADGGIVSARAQLSRALGEQA